MVPPLAAGSTRAIGVVDHDISPRWHGGGEGGGLARRAFVRVAPAIRHSLGFSFVIGMYRYNSMRSLALAQNYGWTPSVYFGRIL